MSAEEDFLTFLAKHCPAEDREKHERNMWIGKSVLGWQFVEDRMTNWVWKTGFMYKPEDGTEDNEQQIFWAERCVNFWNCLDAVAHAEKKIAKLGLGKKYAEVLGRVVWVKACLDTSRSFQVATATARQRCEAMYKMRERIEAARAEQAGQ